MLFSLLTEAVGRPNTKSKESGAKGSMAFLKETFHLGCVSNDSLRESLHCGENGKVGIESHSRVFEGHDVSRKTSGFESANFRSEIHRLPNSRKERNMKPSNRSGAPVETPGNWHLCSQKGCAKTQHFSSKSDCNNTADVPSFFLRAAVSAITFVSDLPWIFKKIVKFQRIVSVNKLEVFVLIGDCLD